MRILTVFSALLVAASPSFASDEAIEALRLELHVPRETVPLGEPFHLRALLLNESVFEVRVAPVFFFAHDHLELKIVGPGGQTVEPPSGALETCSRVDRDWFILLGLGEFVGAELEISPELAKSLNYVYGLEEGCYRLQAALHLDDFAACVADLPEPPPVQGTVSSAEEELCFSAPLPERVAQFRRQLRTDSIEEVLEALIYFSNVPDSEASAEIRALLAPPQNWTSRFPDVYHALTALRRQHDPENAPYFREALDGRFHDLALRALSELEAPSSSS